MNTPSDRDTLLHDLESDGNDYFSAGRTCNIADIVLAICAITTSLIATVLAGTSAPTWVTACMAAAPAAFASAQRAIDLRGRSAWYFRHSARVRALAITLKFAKSPDLEEFARRRSGIEEEMEGEWAAVVPPGAVQVSTNKKKTPGVS